MSLPDGIERFFEQLRDGKERLLMLDYDGTLAPFVKQRDRAFPYGGVPERLRRLIASKNTRTLIVTGRAVEHIKPLLKLERLPEIFGSHGWEHLRPDGSYRLRKAESLLVKTMQRARNFIRDNDYDSYLEEKPASLAIHFRGIEKEKTIEIKDKILHNWNRLRQNAPLVYSEFDGGLELKYPGFDKGSVAKAVLSDYDTVPPTAYLGDDATDEDAFRALPEEAVGILVRPEMRKTSADFWIRPPQELLEFLDRWIEIEEDEKQS